MYHKLFFPFLLLFSHLLIPLLNKAAVAAAAATSSYWVQKKEEERSVREGGKENFSIHKKITYRIDEKITAADISEREKEKKKEI